MIRDPAVEGELPRRGTPLALKSLYRLAPEEKQRVLGSMDLRQLRNVLGSMAGRPAEAVSGVDVADFLLNMGAGRDQFAQVFDDATLQNLEQAGFVIQGSVTSAAGAVQQARTFTGTEPLLPAEPFATQQGVMPPLTVRAGKLVAPEPPQAPALFAENKAAGDYMRSFAKEEERKAYDDLAKGDILGFLGHQLGGVAGTLGRAYETMTSQAKASFGRIGAAMVLNNIFGAGEAAVGMKDLTELRSIADGTDPAKAREYFDEIAQGWPVGTKYLAENSMLVFVDLATPLPIPVGPMWRVMRRLPVTRQITAPVAALGRVLTQLPTDQRIKKFGADVEQTLGRAVTAMPRLDADPVQNTIKVFDRLVNQGDWETLYKRAPRARTEPAFAATLKDIKDLGAKLDLDVWRTPPAPDLAWSPSLIAENAGSQLAEAMAVRLGWKGPTIAGLGPWPLGFMRWLGVRQKQELGNAWLFSRPGFLTLQSVSGNAIIAQHLGLRLRNAARGSEWMRAWANAVGSDAAIWGGRTRHGFFIENLVGRDVGRATAREAPRRGLTARIPILGDRLLPWKVEIPVPKFAEKTVEALTHRQAKKIELPGLTGAMARAVDLHEQLQHRLIQNVVTPEVATYEFARALPPELPEEARLVLTRAFERVDPRITTDEGVQALWEEVVGRLKSGQKLITNPVDAIPRTLDSITQQHLEEELLRLGPEATDDAVRAAWQATEQTLRSETDNVLAQFYSAEPGAVGHRADAYLRFFGQPRDDRSYRVFAEMLRHDEATRLIRGETMDAAEALVIRAAKTPEEAAVAQRVVGQINQTWERIAREDGEATARLMGEYVRHTRAAKTAAEHTAAGERWMVENAGQLQRSAQRYVEAGAELRRFATAPRWSQEVRQAAGRATEALDGLRAEIAVVDKELQAAKKAIRLQSLRPVERDALIAQVSEAAWQKTAAAYQRVAQSFGRTLTPERYSRAIPQEVAEQVLRQIDQARGTDTLADIIDDSLSSILRRETERRVQQLGAALEPTLSTLRSPGAVLDGVTYTADDLLRWRNNALITGSAHGIAKSDELLFSYIYNWAEAGLQTVLPYSYWGARYALLQARYFLKSAGQLHAFAYVLAEWLDMNRDLPPHLQWTVPIIKLPGGHEIRVDLRQLVMPMGYPAMEIMRLGEQDELGLNLVSMVQLTNLAVNGSVYPVLAAAVAGIEAVTGFGKGFKENNPSLYEALFGNFGFIQPLEETVAGLGGPLQRMATAGLAQGPAPTWIYEHGLTQRQRRGVGYMLADWAEQGRRPLMEIQQAIADVQAARPNPLALQAMQEYLGRQNRFTFANWLTGVGFRDYSAAMQESNRLRTQYSEIKATGNTEAVKAFLEEHPGVPARWLIGKEIPEADRRVRVAKFWGGYDSILGARDEALGRTDAVAGLADRERIKQEASQAIDKLKTDLQLTDKDVGFGKDELRVVITGEPLRADHRTGAIKDIAQAYRDMVQVDDFKDDEGVVNMQGFMSAREQWLAAYVPESMREAVLAEIRTKDSLPQAIVSVYSELYVNRYFRETEGMDSKERGAWVAENPPPVYELASEIQKRYPGRWDSGEVNERMLSDDLSLQGYLDIRTRLRIQRVRTAGPGNPYSFRTPNGIVINRDNIEQYAKAFVDVMAYREDDAERTLLRQRIDTLVEQARRDLASLSPWAHLAGMDDPIRAKYFGDNRTGEVGLVDLAVDLRKQADLAPWTEDAKRFFGKAETPEQEQEEILSEMRREYLKLQPSGFRADDGAIAWKEFYQAQRMQMERVLAMGKEFGIDRGVFQRFLDKDIVPTEAVAKYWFEAFLQKALDERSAVKAAQDGRITWAQHQAIAQKYAARPLVLGIAADVRKRYPHITAEQLASIGDTVRVPSFAEYWMARGYSVPRQPAAAPAGGDWLQRYVRSLT